MMMLDGSLTQLHAQLIFFFSLRPPAQGMVLTAMGWIFIHQLIIKTITPTHATD